MGVVLAMHQIDMIMEPEEYLFFAGRPQALALYELFRHQLLAEVGQVQIKVQKTQITFAGRYGFAFVSHPRRKKDVGILVSFGLSHRLDSDRILHVSEPYPNRWTHHILIEQPQEMDQELLGWIKEANWFANEKS